MHNIFLLQSLLLVTICGGFMLRSIAMIRHRGSPSRGRLTILGLSVLLLYGGILLVSIGWLSFGDICWSALEAGVVFIASERALNWLMLRFSRHQLT